MRLRERREQIHGYSHDQLLIELEELRKKAFVLRFQLANQQQKNVRLLPQTKKDIARILGELRDRELREVEE